MWKSLIFVLLYIWLALSLILPGSLSVMAQDISPTALLLTAEGALTPAMAEYLKRGLRTAEQRGAELLIFQLNTPGGSVDLMQDMVETIRTSDIPVIVYVAPRGAIAGSAGTVITLAGHAAAMAPETAIGAASPVDAEGQDLGETLEAKQKNILKATVRSLAENRGEQAITLAESTIETAEAVSSSEALQAGLIDFIANNTADLLEQLDGFMVSMHDGSQIVLVTQKANVVELPPSLIEQFLGILTNPNVVFLLLTIGVQAILIELSSPGGWVAGFIGVVCLALAALGLGVLPVNLFGLVFLGVAFVLFVLDIKAPTHGALTAAGVASLIIGTLVLFNSPGTPEFQRVSIPLVVGVSVATGLVFFGVMTFALRAQRAPIRMGQESMVGRIGIVRTALKPTGQIQLGGELWTAELVERNMSLRMGEKVEVIKVDGLRLYVKPVEQQ